MNRMAGLAAQGVLMFSLGMAQAGEPGMPVPQGAATGFSVVESEMKDAVDTGKLRSVAFALVKGGRIVREGAFGWADREARLAATPHTPYPLASVTKPIVATAVMMLVERGRIDLEEPIARSLPDLAPGFTANVRQLLGHTSGLTTYARINWADHATSARAADIKQSRYAFAAQPPGSLFEYSNLGYGLLGRLIELRSRQKLSEFMRTQLFQPLGMRDASLPDGFDVPKWAARKFDAAGKALPDTWNDTPGAGNLYASAHDLALFSAFHLATEKAASPVLSVNGRRLMQSHVEPGARYDYYGGARYGLGWYVRRTPGNEPMVWHDGGMPGASAIVLMLPQRGVAAIVLINQTDANESAQRFAKALVQTVARDFTNMSMDATEGMARYAGGADLRGRWEGHVVVGDSSAGERKLPWSLTFNGDGSTTVVFPEATGDTPPAQATLRPIVKDGLVLGAFAGSLPVAGVSGGPGRYLLLRLVRHADTLTGALVAYSSEERLEYLLPFAARLERRSD